MTMKGKYDGSNFTDSSTNFKQRKRYAQDHPSMSANADPDMPTSIDFWDPKTVLYGRVDRGNNAIFLNDYKDFFLKDMRGLSTGPSGGRIHPKTGTKTLGSLTQTMPPNLSESVGREMVVDFVADAFTELKMHLSIGLPKMKIRGGPYESIEAKYGWINPTSQYHVYMSALFNTFIEVYLNLEQRYKKINKFEDFVEMFFESYMPHMVKDHPITRTGFLLSDAIGPMSSGLCIEIARENHGEDEDKVKKYISDPTYVYFSQVAAKFGFYIDKNAPWRLVANLNSANMKRWMGFKNVSSISQLFNRYYLKSHVYDMQILRDYLAIAYDKFVDINPFYTITRAVKMRDASTHVRTSSSTVYRQKYVAGGMERYSINFENPTHHHYWFKKYLSIRLTETGGSGMVNEYKLERAAKKAVDINLYSGYYSAINYINDYVKKYTMKSTIARKGQNPLISASTTAQLPAPLVLFDYGIEFDANSGPGTSY